MPELVNRLKFQKQPKFKWEVVQELGSLSGGMNAGISIVRAKDDPQGRKFIQKRFKPKEIRHGIAYKETMLLFQVSDFRYIPSMVDHYINETRQEGSVYLEYCDVGTLANCIYKADDNSFVNEHKIWFWFTQTINAVLYCQRGPKPEDEESVRQWNKVFHRDIKPANILLKKDNGRIVAMLADFGCAQCDLWTFYTKPMSDASFASAHTVGFDVPEFPNYCGSSDVWQLALTMLCVCTGIRSPQSKLNKQGVQWHKDRPAGPKYSEELSAVLKWCLVEDVKRRPDVSAVSRLLKKSYYKIKDRLPPDNDPLDLFDRPTEQVPQPTLSTLPPLFGSHIPPVEENVPDRPAPARRVMSDPEVDRLGRISNSYNDLVGRQRFPPGTSQFNRPWGRSYGSIDDVLGGEYGIFPRLIGGMNLGYTGWRSPYPGFFPPYHFNYDRYGRRR